MFATYALGAAGNVLLLAILGRGLSARFFLRYPAFYSYIAFVTIAGLAQVAIWGLLGLDSAAYYWAWHLPNLLSPFLIIVLLLDIWKRVEPAESSSQRLPVVPLLFVGSAVLVGVRLLQTDGNGFFRYQAVALFVEMLTCIFVYSRVCGRREINLGRNLKGILLGVSLLVGLQGLNFAHLLFVGSPKVVFGFFLQFFYFLALAVFTYSLWSYEPVTVLTAEYRNRLEKVGEELEKAVRILASPR